MCLRPVSNWPGHREDRDREKDLCGRQWWEGVEVKGNGHRQKEAGVGTKERARQRGEAESRQARTDG